MKKIIALILCLVLCFALFVGCSNSDANTNDDANKDNNTTNDDANKEDNANDGEFDWENYELKVTLAHGNADGDGITMYVESWMEKVEELSNGAISFEYYPAGQLGNMTEILEQCNTGSVQMYAADTSYLETYAAKEFALMYYPYLIQTYDHFVKMLKDEALWADMSKLLEDNTDMTFIGVANMGQRNIIAQRELHNLADCKGLVIRSPEIQIYIDTFTLLGMSPTALSYSEMYTALQTGVVEAADCPWQTFYVGGFYQIADYLFNSGHMYTSNFIGANKTWFYGLPQEVQDVMTQAFDDLFDYYSDYIIQYLDDNLQAMLDAGNTLCEWDDIAEPVAAAESYWYEHAEAISPDAVAIVDSIRALA